MPRQRRRRTDRHTNVFVQETAPRGREEIEDETEIAVSEDDSPERAPADGATTPNRSRRLRAQRAARQARVRSEVFTRSIGKELRKLGVLSGVIVVVLVALAFVL